MHIHMYILNEVSFSFQEVEIEEFHCIQSSFQGIGIEGSHCIQRVPHLRELE